MKRHNLKIALVIEPVDGFRRSAVQFLRNRGWIVHGVRRAEHAFPVLTQIPYNLVVIGSEQAGMTMVEFVRVISTSKVWNSMSLAVIAKESDGIFDEELMSLGAFLTQKATWKGDLLDFLATVEDPVDGTLIPAVEAKRVVLAG